jgi:tRNA G46 methylase TrmB
VSAELAVGILPEYDLALSDDEVWAAIQPFVSAVCTKDDPVWAEALRAQSRRLRKQWFRNLLQWGRNRVGRDQADVEAVYSARWARDRFSTFVLPDKPKGGTAWYWKEKGLTMKAEGGRRARILYLMRVIEMLKPRRVLEVGFGDGLNLALLAARFPDIRFCGVELTSGGYQTACSLLDEAQLPSALRDFSPEPLLNVRAHLALELHQASVLEMPFADGSFDLVFTSLALEQMERIRAPALAAVSRVTQHHAAFIEPFADFNADGLKRRYVRSLGYFKGTVAELTGHGLHPTLVRADLPYKVHLQPALVVARKRGTDSARP